MVIYSSVTHGTREKLLFFTFTLSTKLSEFKKQINTWIYPSSYISNQHVNYKFPCKYNLQFSCKVKFKKACVVTHGTSNTWDNFSCMNYESYTGCSNILYANSLLKIYIVITRMEEASHKYSKIISTTLQSGGFRNFLNPN